MVGRICYCNTRGLTSHCQGGDIRGWGRSREPCLEEGRHASLLPGLRAGLEAAARHRTQAPEAGRVLAAASGPPSRPRGRFTMRTRGLSGIISRPVSSAESKINKICTFQAMENANCFYSSTSVPGVLCSQPKGTDL